MSCSAGAAELASEHFVIKSERRDKKCDRGEREKEREREGRAKRAVGSLLLAFFGKIR